MELELHSSNSLLQFDRLHRLASAEHLRCRTRNNVEGAVERVVLVGTVGSMGPGSTWGESCDPLPAVEVHWRDPEGRKRVSRWTELEYRSADISEWWHFVLTLGTHA